MLEKDIENLIAKYPEEFFPNEGFNLINQQENVEGKRIDILFEDKYKRKIIVEVKRGILTREASGQIAEYYGLLKEKDQSQNIELILCANIIPKERKTFLETIGIDCKELGVKPITDLAKRYNYKFLDDHSNFDNLSDEDTKPSQPKEVDDVELTSNDENPSVWIFQANPNRYDILNALSDKEIGNNIHWLVNQYKTKIHKNHLALIWMSGKDSGIYAITRIESEPMILSEYNAEKKYWLSENEVDKKLRVKLTIINNLTNKPIFKNNLLKLNGLSNLSIFRQFQGTNFPVRDSEWRIISQLL